MEKLKNWQEIAVIVQGLQNEGKKAVFTNGCFDVLHKGHITYLREARALGDILIVGLNSDNSVKRLKGNNRPVHNELDRALLLSELISVSYITIFEQDTPYDLIDNIKPDILVKGGDWAEEEIVGSDIVKTSGGKVISLKFIDGYSSTDIINRMKNGK